MPAKGHAWNTARDRFRAECLRTHAPCWLCFQAIDYDAPPRTPRSFTADHVTPTSLGGDATRASNLKPAHYSCNSSRGNTTRGQFPTSRAW